MNDKHCSRCGAKLIQREVGAENYGYSCSSYGYGPNSYGYEKYNRETGKKNFIKEYICPKSSWRDVFCLHDRYEAGGVYNKP